MSSAQSSLALERQSDLSAQWELDLAAPDPARRRRAARALAGVPEMAAQLAARLHVEYEPDVRAALFGSLTAIGGPAAPLLSPLIRSPDPALRNAAVAALKLLGPSAAPALDALLEDPSPDIRLLAIEITRAWPVLLATPRLLRLIEHDTDINVCAAAVEVATAVGTAEMLPGLARLSKRFAGHKFLNFCINIARARIEAGLAAAAFMSDVDFQGFAEIFYRHTGILFEDFRRYYVEKRLRTRAGELGFPNLSAYLAPLLRGETPGELSALVTLFAGSPHPFNPTAPLLQAIATHMIPECRGADPVPQPLRIWVAGCGTGEAAYSLAIQLAEPAGALPAGIEITASDTDPAQLVTAQAGRYAAAGLAHLDPALRARYFTEAAPDTQQLIPAIRAAILFEALAPDAPPATPGYDIILCPNLLLHQPEAARAAITANFFDALRPGGFLCLGESESISRSSALFQIRAFPSGAVAYQKRKLMPGATL
jgi:chemotaxis protein methyltransferase CheR